MAAVQAGELPDTLEEILRETPANPTRDQLRMAYSAALLSDILKAGGNAWVRESRVFVAWPNWEGAEGREFARAAMSAAREMRHLTREEVQRVQPLFAPDLDGEELAEVLREAKFSLVVATAVHPLGISYQEAFGAALRYWSMPYRGRTGRMKRFVLTAEHRNLGRHPVVAGILELGDEAPFCNWRDDLLGLSPGAFTGWLARAPIQTRSQIADRLRAIRSCLRPTSLDFDLSNASARDIVSHRIEIEEFAQGRSRVLAAQHDLLKDRKRMAYGLRLARGQMALEQIAKGGEIPLGGADLMAGVRAVHDLILPRTHLEATVCGAVPPFSAGMGGKLIVSFLSHPSVVSSTLDAEGELVGWSFDSDRLKDLLPSHGMLCITTKGLYANHAAIYTRSEMPGLHAPIRLRHLANTGGITTTLVSDRTTRLARQLLEDPGENQARISSVYGSGGAKRHRAIHTATIAAGLPPRIAFAGIRRPVYGLKYATNAEAVCWLGDNPVWAISRNENSEAFDQRAVDLWRRRWLRKGIERIQDFAVVPSLGRMLEGGLTMASNADEAETVE